MTATLLPLADHGDILSALPFVAPMALIVVGLLVLVARDRLAARRGNRSPGPSA